MASAYHALGGQRYGAKGGRIGNRESRESGTDHGILSFLKQLPRFWRRRLAWPPRLAGELPAAPRPPTPPLQRVHCQVLGGVRRARLKSMKHCNEGDAHRNPTDGEDLLIAIACWVTARGWLRSSLPLSRCARLTQPTRAHRIIFKLFHHLHLQSPYLAQAGSRRGGRGGGTGREHAMQPFSSWAD